MEFEQAKQKALDRVRERGVDRQLIGAYLETRHYVAWSTNQSNNDWNIGLENITAVEVEDTPANRSVSISTIAATVDGIPFKIIGACKISCMSDNTVFTTETVWLHLNDRCVIEANYSVDTLDAIIPDHYTLFSVDEYHESDELNALLSRLTSLIENKKLKYNAKMAQLQAERYQGKFSFKD